MGRNGGVITGPKASVPGINVMERVLKWPATIGSEIPAICGIGGSSCLFTSAALSLSSWKVRLCENDC